MDDTQLTAAEALLMSDSAKERGYSRKRPGVDIQVNPDKLWVNTRQVIAIAIMSALAAAAYMRIDSRIAGIEATLQGVHGELRNGFTDAVSVRQMQNLLELLRASNREKFPAIVWPDLPR